MKRKAIIIPIVLFLIIFAGIVVAGKMLMGFIFTNGFDIKIENNTNSKISGLKITYMNATKDIAVPTVGANSRVKLNINPAENFGENSMKLYYFDKKSNRHEETIVGYFEKGYSGRVEIEIESIDDIGRLNMKVEETS